MVFVGKHISSSHKVRSTNSTIELSWFATVHYFETYYDTIVDCICWAYLSCLSSAVDIANT